MIRILSTAVENEKSLIRDHTASVLDMSFAAWDAEEFATSSADGGLAIGYISRGESGISYVATAR